MPANAVRADYLLGKAWLAAGRGDLADHYAARTLAGCAAAGLADFDLAYAHELHARALAVQGRTDEATAAADRARGIPIADPEDRALVEADLADLPG